MRINSRSFPMQKSRPRPRTRGVVGRWLAPFCWLTLASCAAQPPIEDPVEQLPAGAEAMSLLGKPLFATDLPDSLREKREAELEQAREKHEADPTNLDDLIWYGRRLAYLGRYRDAIAIYTGGLVQQPQEPRLYRHRGHRYITLRRLDDAIWDLERAARLIEGTPDRVEQDGLPNARNQPTSTLHSNIWYHLGLALYLKGENERALEAYRQCAAVSKNPDMICATLHWLYMTLRRLGRNRQAKEVIRPVRADMDIIENHAYHRLLLLYKGEIKPRELREELRSDEGSIESASLAYGLANWYREEGRAEEGRELLEEIVRAGQWPAFGHAAAEADLARMPPER